MSIETSSNDAVSRITDSVLREVAYCLKQAPGNIDPHLPFADMGADSLILLEVLQEINARFHVSLTVLEIYERVNTIAKVARHIHEQGASVEPQVATEPEVAALPELSVANLTPRGDGGRQGLEDIVRQQLDLMARQLSLFGKRPAGTAANERTPERSAPATLQRANPAESAAPAPVRAAPAASPGKPEADRFSAFSVKLGKDEREDDAEKVAHIQQLTASVTTKAPESKRLAQRYRQVLADNRVSAGFRPLLKEMVFPISAEKAQGAHVTDVDGNSYLDFTMGFGAHFFGHSPDFVTNAVKAQLERGMPIGPQSPLAGRVAELICELTGHARVTFCNTGTEATMTAVRLARAKTGRDKVVIFRNSYHGTFDAFLARGSASSDESRPASLGTPGSLVKDTVVLDYCEQSALDYIERHAKEIAAVLAEPVQSRAPSMQPAAFLRQLRRLTQERDIALIFDEVIAGFRCARGGAQQLFGVRADMCTYGKVLGGGMPIGVVAGSAAYMDVLDGGFWQYGDASFPGTPTIFFAGTFTKHPLAMAASLAVLEHIQGLDDQLYRSMNERTERLSAQLNAAFEEEGADVTVEHFSSLFRFSTKGNLDVFYYRLLEAGYFIWEGRNCFLSTAHTDAELSRFVQSVRKIARELVAHRLLPLRDASKAERPLADAQRRFHELVRSGPDGSVACNLCYGLRFDEAVDIDRLSAAIVSVLSGQEALWSRFDLERKTQKLLPTSERRVHIERAELAERSSDPGLIDRLMADQQKAPLAPDAGANVRVNITRFADGATLVGLCVHHLVCDGWALVSVFERIAALYSESPGTSTAHVPYTRWSEHEANYRQGEQYASDKRYWQGALDAIAGYQRGHAFGALRHRGAVGGRPGGRARLSIGEEVTALFKEQARADGVTPFTALLAGFQVFLNRAYRTRLPILGIPFANRTTRDLKQVVGTCVNLLPLLPVHGQDATFDTILARARHDMAELFKHAMFPYQEMCEQYRAVTSEAQGAPVEVTFNVEPVSQLPRFGSHQPALVAAVNDRIEFDLCCNVFVLPTDITIELDYDTGLFAEDAVYGLLNLYSKIVENYAKRADAARRSNMPARGAA
ncbi:aminotransferase class III-fold pyridoxal phosphate-dependent enzyme [Corallococcus silvisoli]|uniref:aminotransferase class III-fold pyridoxal phosphate-dependent enzyme n=1 Tax=Corallococcus silvisoli TaxID=2697031 RepID=UPI001376D26A|nr:aminotransferase class III-fold pyridoxal phosphate-dependent enzyme [Corallococcus silvisoli]NBD10811.1 aminotransferase class III-fold pyridoxal phosphate-dependent enzyme [Corallococcus silvisoli]